MRGREWIGSRDGHEARDRPAAPPAEVYAAITALDPGLDAEDRPSDLRAVVLFELG